MTVSSPLRWLSFTSFVGYVSKGTTAISSMFNLREIQNLTIKAFLIFYSKEILDVTLL